jgi:hypothetical protein
LVQAGFAQKPQSTPQITLMKKRSAVSNQPSAVSQNLFIAKDAEPPHQAKTGLDGSPGDAKENGGSPLIDADERGSEGKTLPLIILIYTDQKYSIGPF